MRGRCCILYVMQDWSSGHKMVCVADAELLLGDPQLARMVFSASELNRSTKHPTLDGIIPHVCVSGSRRLVLIRIPSLSACACGPVLFLFYQNDRRCLLLSCWASLWGCGCGCLDAWTTRPKAEICVHDMFGVVGKQTTC